MSYKNINIGKRSFLKQALTGAAYGIVGVNLLIGCSKKEDDEEGNKKVSPPEDLMQEHGVLKRVLLIYDACHRRLLNKESFPVESITNAAGIIRSFIEDYHEKQEEDYIFPRFRKANQLTDLVQILLDQHNAGRRVTDEIVSLSKTSARSDSENQRLAELLLMFNTMYSPHEAREDTVLFPAFRKIVTKHEYDALGEEFEKNEKKKFGEDGFSSIVNKVADIERNLGIYELAQFTPKI